MSLLGGDRSEANFIPGWIAGIRKESSRLIFPPSTRERGLVSHDFTDKPLLECVLHEASICARSSAEIS
jgi:hypothetical protein